MNSASSIDIQVRNAAFDFLRNATQFHGDVLPRALLAKGFEFQGRRVPLIGPQGIFKPAVLELPLSITTAPEVEGKARPYEDGFDYNDLLCYRYRGTDPSHRDNVGLRLAMQHKIPLIYLFGVVKGLYQPFWPVFIVNDEPDKLSFSVAVDEAKVGITPAGVAEQDIFGRRLYKTIEARQRMHQQSFRIRVLLAYHERCAICRLKHQELLEAAHILPDSHPKGLPLVSNGLALCSLHHGAFDRQILGIRPDYIIEVRKDVLNETDGPMLKHGLQGFHGQTIMVPKPDQLKPDQAALEERFELFKKAI